MSNQQDIADLTELVRTYVMAMTRGDRPALERIFFDRASEVGHYAITKESCSGIPVTLSSPCARTRLTR